MTFTHDIYAETNPAFCAFALVAFTAAHESVGALGPELPTAYVALPIALSSDLGSVFEGSNKKTGLLEWLTRSPQVQLGLSSRLNSSMNIVTEAFRFGCFSGVIKFNETDARLVSGETAITRGAMSALGVDARRAIKHAERLGHWFAAAGSTRTIFDMMGLTL